MDVGQIVVRLEALEGNQYVGREPVAVLQKWRVMNYTLH